MSELSPRSYLFQDFHNALSSAFYNAIPHALHRQMSLSTDDYLALLATPDINRKLFDQHPEIPGHPQSLIALSSWLSQLTPEEADYALSEFENATGEITVGNDWRHEVSHYRKARELGFENPEFFVYAFYDKYGNTALHWLMVTGPVPDRMTDDDLRLALYEILLAPDDPSASDRQLAAVISNYYRSHPDQNLKELFRKLEIQMHRLKKNKKL